MFATSLAAAFATSSAVARTWSRSPTYSEGFLRAAVFRVVVFFVARGVLFGAAIFALRLVFFALFTVFALFAVFLALFAAFFAPRRAVVLLAVRFAVFFADLRAPAALLFLLAFFAMLSSNAP